MKSNANQTGVALLVVLLLSVVSALAARAEKSDDSTPEGVLELECNISQVDLYLCPRDNWVRTMTERFFGLIKSHEESCSAGQLFLGSTPLEPRSVPAGQYMLLIPPGYAWEHEGPVEINIQPDKRSFFLLKLFSRNAKPSGIDPADAPGAAGNGVGAGGGGSGSGGAPGTPPP